MNDMRVDIFGDNKGAKTIADNASCASRSKLIDVKLHFLRGLVRTQEDVILHITKEQLAGILTKAL